MAETPFRLDRDAETSPRRLAILIGVGVVLILGALWLFSGREASAPPAAPAPAPAPPLPPAPPPQAAVPAPAVSAAQLVLHGVMGTGEDGAAIIAVGGQQRLVRVGRDIAPGLSLVSIGADHIVLRERGQEVRLGFPEGVGTTSAASLMPSRTAHPGEPDPEQLARETIFYQRAMEPHRDANGQRDGYRLNREIPPMLTRAGLRPGDILVRLGGTTMESPDDIEHIARDMATKDRIPIVFLRDGETQTIFFEPR